MGRASFVGAVAIVLASFAGTSFAGDVDRDAEQRSFDLVNDERAERGLQALRWSAELAGIAREHSQRMADDGDISHNPNLQSQAGDWQALAENVGTGPSADAVHEMFMDSASHRAAILGDFTEVGIGVVEQDDALWVTQVFRTPAQAPEPARKRRASTPARSLTPSTARTVYRAARVAAAPVRVAPPAEARDVSRTVETLERFNGDYEGPVVIPASCRRDPAAC